MAEGGFPMLVDRPGEALHAHALFSPADRLNGRLHGGGNGSRETPRNPCVFPEVTLKFSNLRP
jgi:hypothetical protein